MAETRNIFLTQPSPELPPLRTILNEMYRSDETHCVNNLLKALSFTTEVEEEVSTLARGLITKIREEEGEKSGMEALMAHYDLSTEEGILLMCLAEALLRIPDKETENLLIQDKLTSAAWNKRVEDSESAFVSFATWGLALSVKILKKSSSGYFRNLWSNLIRKSGEPIIRKTVREAMRLLSENFVVGRTIDEALKRSESQVKQGYYYSYDMLGEVARTKADADRYFEAYLNAIAALGKSEHSADFNKAPSVSVKLSALHPRYQFEKREIIVPDLTRRVKKLAVAAKNVNISMTIDAEEADRLDISLDIFEELCRDAALSDWDGLGLAVQAYQKRAFFVLDWLIDLSRQVKRRIPVRLVKGAYWDTEIKLSQMNGFVSYPVFTRKVNTDVSYLACAKKMLTVQDAIYPQFATHNAYSVAAILTMMEEGSRDYHQYEFEFQHLQGMGKALHDYVVNKLKIPCRIYAPVGKHEDLLPYLVRRLLENGSNSSFVNRIADKNMPISALAESPVANIAMNDSIPNPTIPAPKDIYSESRRNSFGVDFSNRHELDALSKAFALAEEKTWEAAPFCRPVKNGRPVLDPSDHRRQIGITEEATNDDVETAVKKAVTAFDAWDRLGVEARAAILKKAGDLLEYHRAELMYLVVREGGRTVMNAMSEVREAIDFCRYYAWQAETHLANTPLKGYTGEEDTLSMRGRGVLLCVSPWNFPAAIFTGQMAASLVTGNAVIVKPSQQTTLTGALVTRLFHEAGVPEAVLQLMPGRGEIVGHALVKNPAISGVLLTGSNETAKHIQRTLAERDGEIVPLIAETGGINAMIADSTALSEQLVQDVITSAFDSAGQRCSALRVLFIQEDIADSVINMLAGAMAEIKMGDPMLLMTDVGPVIDASAKKNLEAHQTFLEKEAKLIYRVELPELAQHGAYVAPQAYELPSVKLLVREVFGPILHVIRYHRDDLDQVIDDINALGYGLTFGIQSRIDERVEYIQRRIKAGNIYVNRNIIGAVVGLQPFGGGRLSGTGPKAGGPHYLSRLCTETTLSVNTTAAGGNASLMAMD